MADPTAKPATPKAIAAPATMLAPAKPVARTLAKQPAAQVRAAPDTKPAVVEPAVTAAKDQTMDTINTITDKTETMFAGANDRAKDAMAKGTRMFDEMTAFNKGNIDAIVESSKIAAKGFETLGQDAVAYARKSFETSTAAARTLASVKSPAEFMKLHSDYVRSAVDMMVAEGSRSTEAMLKLAGEVAQPISNRVALAAEKVKIAA